jgi:hypothetical protein
MPAHADGLGMLIHGSDFAQVARNPNRANGGFGAADGNEGIATPVVCYLNVYNGLP